MCAVKWVVESENAEAAGLEQAGFSRLTAILLANRGITSPEEARLFLTPSADTLHDPFMMKGMESAVKRIKAALEENEKIAVYGDYDADGVTATALLFSYLKEKRADVSHYIPARETEGYGLNTAAVEKLARDGASLIITVDTGISAFAEAQTARDCGIDLIVTDHHEPRDGLPDAYCIVNPRQPGCGYPFKGLAGVGVAFKLVCALEGVNGAELLTKYGGLVCIGTIADIVPLEDENRFLARDGLKILSAGGNAGIAALCTASGISADKINASAVAFILSPRLNACGRLGSAGDALQLLLGGPQDAGPAAEKLNALNTQRREIEADIYSDAMKTAEKDPELLEKPVILLSGEGWHNGVVGIVASRVTERFGRPCILVSFEGDEGRASCRSVPGFDIFAALSGCGELLEKYGGHKLAAGFTIKKENLAAFTEKIMAFAASLGEPPRAALVLECALAGPELTLSAAREIEKLEPFGSGNSVPLFYLPCAKVTGERALSGGKHLRLSLLKDGKSFEALIFRAENRPYLPQPGDYIDLAASLGVNAYRGKESLSVLARDLRPAAVFARGARLYEQFREGGLTDEAAERELSPAREEFAAVYRFYKKYSGSGFDIRQAFLSINRRCGTLNYFKFRLITDIFEETALIRSRLDGTRLHVQINGENKIDLGSSELLKSLKRRLTR